MFFPQPAKLPYNNVKGYMWSTAATAPSMDFAVATADAAVAFDTTDTADSDTTAAAATCN